MNSRLARVFNLLMEPAGKAEQGHEQTYADL